MYSKWINQVTSDEIRNFQDAQYMFVSKTLGKHLGFDIGDRRSLVVRLDKHLEIDHSFCFEERQERQAAAQRRAGTQLKEWFTAI